MEFRAITVGLFSCFKAARGHVSLYSGVLELSRQTTTCSQFAVGNSSFLVLGVTFKKEFPSVPISQLEDLSNPNCQTNPVGMPTHMNSKLSVRAFKWCSVS